MHTNIILPLIFLRLTGSQDVNLLSTKENYYADELMNLEIQLTNKGAKSMSYIQNGNNSAFWKVKITNLTSGNELNRRNTLLVKYAAVEKKDYKTLEPGETGTARISIDFNQLVIKRKEQHGVLIPIDGLFTTEPDSMRHGKYRISVAYYDLF